MDGKTHFLNTLCCKNKTRTKMCSKNKNIVNKSKQLTISQKGITDPKPSRQPIFIIFNTKTDSPID